MTSLGVCVAPREFECILCQRHFTLLYQRVCVKEIGRFVRELIAGKKCITWAVEQFLTSFQLR